MNQEEINKWNEILYDSIPTFESESEMSFALEMAMMAGYNRGIADLLKNWIEITKNLK